jgi:hypothetical protein
MLTEPELVEFLDCTLQDQLRELLIDPAAGAGWRRSSRAPARRRRSSRWRCRSLDRGAPGWTSAQLYWWLDRGTTLRAGGKRLVPLLLRRKIAA